MNKQDITRVRELAIYLEGVKAGKGLLPLGHIHLESLWTCLKELNQAVKERPER